MAAIKGLLLDNGHTLARPTTPTWASGSGGEWWFGPWFHEVLARHGIGGLLPSDLDAALPHGMAYLDQHHHLTTEREELDQFSIFYQRVLGSVGMRVPDERIFGELAAAKLDTAQMEAYPDVIPFLRFFKQQHLTLGLVSNTWPSLERIYQALGLRDFFDVFVISAHVGCVKPDRRIFEHAIKGTGLPADTLFFVDDEEEYVQEALRLGMRATVMVREGQPPTGGLPWVRGLADVDALVAAANR